MNNRREFLADVGRGMLVASVGPAVAADLGLSRAFAEEGSDKLNLGKFESLASFLQDTSTTKLIPALIQKLKDGLDLKTLVAAGALANAREFGGQHYDGYHTFMALSPAYEMSKELPEASRALPILKVLYRNSTHIQAKGGRKNEALHEVKAVPVPEGRNAGEMIRDLTRKNDTAKAEGIFATVAHGNPADAFNELQYCVEDEVNVHRVVLAWRAWAMLDFTGPEQAHTLLRQSVLFCCRETGRGSPKGIATLLPKLLDQYKLVGKKTGARSADDKWIEDLSQIVYRGGRDKAADAVAAAMGEGFSLEAVGEAIALAANTLVLRDPGRSKPDGAKQIGSVHGASVGVHASDAANAWRNIAKVSNQRNAVASLIVGAYHTAGQNGGQLSEAYPQAAHRDLVKSKNPAELLKLTEAAIREQNQKLACALRINTANSINRPGRSSTFC